MIDFTSDAPTVISGSHNLSTSASGGNDENFLIIRGAVDVADCYGVELMRLYDHYRFRWHQSPRSARPGDPPPPPEDPEWPHGTLAPDDRWAKAYFEDGTLEAADRLCFARARRVGVYRPGGWRATKPPVGRICCVQRVPPPRSADVSKRQPPTTMKAWPALA